MLKRIVFFFFVVLFLFSLPRDGRAAAKKIPLDQKIEKAPSLPRRGVWFNAKPDLKELFGQKVTLVYFWDYTSINCIREFSYLKQWYDRYHPYGFEILTIHSPELEFAKPKENVQKAVKRLGIPYPVFLDNDFKLWEKYNVRTWPTKVVVDGEGIIVHSQSGEEGYLETENKIREALKKVQSKSVLPEPFFAVKDDKFNAEKCGAMSPETYVGYERAGWWGGEVANKKSVLPDETALFHDRGKRVERGFFAEGLWTNHKENFEHARETQELSDYIGITYVAAEVYAILHQADGMGISRVYVTRDDQPVPRDLRGNDVREDLKGETYFLLQEPRLYYLVANEDEDSHDLKLWVQKKGTAISSFAFSNHCLSDFDHL